MLPALLAKVPENVGRWLGFTFFLGFLGWRVWWLRTIAREPLGLTIWGLESLVFVLFLVAYVRRVPAFERAGTWWEILLPAVGGPFPFLLFSSPVAPRAPDGRIAGLLLAGDSIAVVSYFFLAGSFSILVEARPLRSGGPYRLIRHPVYLGQIIATLGVLLLRFSTVNLALWPTFVAIQVGRAFLEERKMLRATPGYAEYRARTWMLVPFLL